MLDEGLEVLKVDIFGDFACFTQSDAKVERVSYPVITPSAARNILSAIYAKPVEFYYEIIGIDVMRPIRYFNMRMNEVIRKATADNISEPLMVDDLHTQRGTRFLYDVYYRIYFVMHRREDCHEEKVTQGSIQNQLKRRVKKGQCFYQPYLGMKGCMCFFSEPDSDVKPINESKDLGIMLYDAFSIDENVPLDTDKKAKVSGKVNLSYYHPYMINGHIDVPKWGSREIFKVE